MVANKTTLPVISPIASFQSASKKFKVTGSHGMDTDESDTQARLLERELQKLREEINLCKQNLISNISDILVFIAEMI
jgi:hypothetical protein